MKSKNYIIILLLLSIVSCSSRYRLDLFMKTETGNKKVKVEKTDYISNVRLGDPFGDIKILPGESNVGILTVGSRGFSYKRAAEDFLTFDEYLRNRIYFQFPLPLKRGTFDLKDNLAIKRPANGINPMRWDEIVTAVASKDYIEDELI